MTKRKSFVLRISEDLYREIEAWANAELRSVNGQMEFILKNAIGKRKGAKATDKSKKQTTEQ